VFYTSLLVYIFAGRACSNIRPEYIESARCLGADSRMIFRRIYMPACVPELLGGLRIALAGAWGLEAIGELMGVDSGIGYLIKFYSDSLNVLAMVALVVLLGATAIIFDFILVRIAHIFIRWAAAGSRLNL
jgi:ABC-type nitrate/sulfonate/bicarbonate transport system permease component